MVVRRSDVARLAGTSPSVVSYVLNDGPRRVAPETRARVLAAIEELGYRPDPIARSLALRRTQTLGLVVPDLADPVFGRLARAVEDAALDRGYRLLVGSALDDPGRQAAYIRDFVDRRVDGLVIVPGAAEDAAEVPTEVAVPWVALGRQSDTGVAVRVDDREVGRQAARHLVEHGRRVIACLAGPAESRSVRERVKGWREVRAETGMDARVHYVAAGPRSAYDRARRLLTERTDVDALFVASDQQAIGALRAIADVGLRCPDDVAVVAADGLPEVEYVAPSLTTVAQPFTDLGRTAVERLLARLDPAPATPSAAGSQPSVLPASAEDVVLPATLLVRESCGCVMRVEPV